jgi:hypothetical protein
MHHTTNELLRDFTGFSRLTMIVGSIAPIRVDKTKMNMASISYSNQSWLWAKTGSQASTTSNLSDQLTCHDCSIATSRTDGWSHSDLILPHSEFRLNSLWF